MINSCKLGGGVERGKKKKKGFRADLIAVFLE